MINYILASLAGLCATSQSTLTKLAPGSEGKAYIMGFNTVKVGSAFLLFLLISLHSLSFHFETLLSASAYGLALFFSTLFGYLALACGSLALTSSIVSYSVVIPVVFGIIFLEEDINAVKLCGFVLLLVSLMMLKKPTNDVGSDKKWLLYLAITFLCNGTMSIIQKLHQTTFPLQYRNEFTIYSMFICLLQFALSAFLCRNDGKMKIENVKFAAPAGVLMGLNNYLTLSLSSLLDASVLFPTVSVFQVVFNLTFSKFIFKEKLSLLQIFGVVIGVISVLLIK